LEHSRIDNQFIDLEIHSLVCSRDVLMALNNYKSLQKYEEFKTVPIYLHDDGSLTDCDIELLNTLENIKIIDRKYADSKIEKYIKNHKYSLQYRLGRNNINLWHKIKLFDYYYLSESKKILCIDTDLLFINRPKVLIDYIISGTPFYFPDIQNAYCFNKSEEEVLYLDKVNTGIIFIPSENYYNIDDIEFALSNLIKDNTNNFPSWIEQSAFAHMFYKQNKYTSLPSEKYRIPFFQTIDIDKIECLHFVSFDSVRELYDEYVNYLNIEENEIVYKKKFFIKFNDYKIPLQISIFKKNSILLLKYFWGIKEVSNSFLNHIFRIEYENDNFEKLCQSESNGFLIFKIKNSYFKIHHTYEWYGDTNWILLDEIYL
jgi:hypothetical protein